MMELNPILLPVDWTPEKDFQYYEERWGEPEGDYFGAVLARVAESYQNLRNEPRAFADSIRTAR